MNEILVERNGRVYTAHIARDGRIVDVRLPRKVTVRYPHDLVLVSQLGTTFVLVGHEISRWTIVAHQCYLETWHVLAARVGAAEVRVAERVGAELTKEARAANAAASARRRQERIAEEKEVIKYMYRSPNGYICLPALGKVTSITHRERGRLSSASSFKRYDAVRRIAKRLPASIASVFGSSGIEAAVTYLAAITEKK